MVARTRDGGESFEVLRRGLPQRHAYDLVWRHALEVDASGERLAFGSTTGGLWISEDARRFLDDARRAAAAGRGRALRRLRMRPQCSEISGLSGAIIDDFVAARVTSTGMATG